MFYLSRIEHTLHIPPHLLSLPIQEAVHKELEKLFLDKVVANLGLCVSVYDIRSIEGGFIFPGEGAATYMVVFTLIMFRPFVGEIIAAKLLASDSDGLRLSLGFFDDIYVPAHHMPNPSHFEGEPKNSCHCGQIKFRVQSVSYPSIPVEQPNESKPFAPMVVTGSLDHDGLGPVSWWYDTQEIEDE
ncbi:DNA-directed RNA polymerase III subunit RPC8 [Senna tora]|uniref:DNA-directed RNA polymerase subunit n=1 Tax=Senna tora TaxID=362788 RepID=A0A835CDE6_9FABA|nr:DNA-directed RNA polymerase III subunit RPC8 [Senna tora]